MYSHVMGFTSHATLSQAAEESCGAISRRISPEFVHPATVKGWRKLSPPPYFTAEWTLTRSTAPDESPPS